MKMHKTVQALVNGSDSASFLKKACKISGITDILHAFFVCMSTLQNKQQVFIYIHHLNFFKMNRTFAKRSFQAMLTMLIVLGGMLLSNRVEAQQVSTTTVVGAPQQQQWLTEQEALAVLVTEMSGLKDQLQYLTPGTPDYINVENHITYFLSLYYGIEGGVSVPDAVGSSLSNNAATSTLSKSQLNGLYNEAVDLLTK
jgi:hypothetical protein